MIIIPKVISFYIYRSACSLSLNAQLEKH